MISDKTYDKNLLHSIIEYGIFVFSVTFLIAVSYTHLSMSAL